MKTPSALPRVRYLTSYPVDPTGAVTGPQRVMRNVIQGVKVAGVDVEVWSAPYHRSDRRREELVDDGVRVHFVGPFSALGAAIRRPEQVLHIGSFSLFHAMPLAARRLLGRFRKIGPIVYTAHGLLAIEARHGARVVPLLTPWVERLLLTHSDRIVVLSKQMADLVTSHYGIPAERIEIVGTTIPVAFRDFETTRPDIPSAEPRFIYAGEFRDVKALDVLSRALGYLHRSDPERPWTLIVAGGPHPSWTPPPEWDELRDLGRIKTLGRLPTDELADAYASALCLVLPSRYEPYGMVVLEAMACGTPAIVSDRVGARDLIDDGSSGIVVPYGDETALSIALSAALDDPAKFVEMGSEARRSVQSRSEADVAAHYIQIYRA